MYNKKELHLKLLLAKNIYNGNIQMLKNTCNQNNFKLNYFINLKIKLTYAPYILKSIATYDNDHLMKLVKIIMRENIV